MDLKLEKKKKQNWLYITFRDNAEEIELYNWIIQKTKVGGVSNYFKLLALKDKEEQEQEGK
jgi:hypothetical protein